MKTLFEYAKQFSEYHYDTNQPDDGIIFKPKFQGKWQEELKHFSPKLGTGLNLDNVETKMQIQEWLNLGYNVSNHNNKDIVDDRFPKLQKICNYFDFDEKQQWLTKQQTCQHIPYHHDTLTSSNLPLEEVSRRGWRCLIFLTNWQPGQFIIFGHTNIDKWQAGSVLAWPAIKFPHATANMSHYDAFRLRISGLATDNLFEFLNNDEQIYV